MVEEEEEEIEKVFELQLKSWSDGEHPHCFQRACTKEGKFYIVRKSLREAAASYMAVDIISVREIGPTWP